MESLKQSGGQQQAQGASFTPQRANVLLRPLAAAAAAAEHIAQDAAHATPALPSDAAKASAHPTPATGAMLPTPLLMTPAGATLLQTPASSAAWAALRPGDAAAALGLSPAVALAGAGVRPVAAFPHFLSGVMATPMLQQRPGQQQAAEADDGKLSKKRQGYHIEPAALQKLIEKQQLEAQRKQEQQQGGTAAGNSSQASRAAAAAAAAAGATADKNAEDPPPRQQQQQHRPRVLSRLPPQVREQAERQAAERARKQQEEAEAQEAGEAAGSSRAQAAAGPGALSQQQMLTAADCLGSPDGSMGGLQLRVRDLDPQDMELEEPGKLFGSAQKRLRLSLCDDQGSPTRGPSSHPMVSPVELPTPSPAMVPAPTPAPALAAGASSTAAQAAAAATASAEAPTPSKFFSGSPVPQAQRRAVLPQTYPDTPVALGQPPLKQEAQEVLLEPFRGGAQGPEGQPGQAEAGSSSWVPVPGQAPAVPGATPVPAGPPAAVEGDELLLDPAAAAAMPLPESPVPVKQVAAEPHQQHKQQQQGGGEGGPMLQTPQGQEQQGTATPVTGL